MTNTRMQWFILIFFALWICIAMILPVVAFCLTRNPACFTLFSTLAPPIIVLRRIVGFLFPKHEKEYDLAALKIKYAARRNNKKMQVK